MSTKRGAGTIFVEAARARDDPPERRLASMKPMNHGDGLELYAAPVRHNDKLTSDRCASGRWDEKRR